MSLNLSSDMIACLSRLLRMTKSLICIGIFGYFSFFSQLSQVLAEETAVPSSGAGIGSVNVTVKGNHYVPTDEITRVLGISGSVPISQAFSMLAERTVRAKLLTNPWIEDVSLEWRLLPTSLTVRVFEAKPFLVLTVGDLDRDESWVISENGRPIAPLTSVLQPDLVMDVSSLARLQFNLSDGAIPASKSESVYRDSLRQVANFYAARDLPFEVEAFSVLADGGLKLYPLEVGKFPTVNIYTKNFAEMEKNLQRLGAILSDLENKGEKAVSIDLRYSNQAVVNRG